MIARRNLLGLLLGSPLAAPAAAIATENVLSSSVGETAVEYPGPNPLRDLYDKHRRMIEDKRMDQTRPVDHMPWNIAGKRSWSPAFKSHVFCKEQEAYRDNWNWFDESPRTMARALRSIGIDPNIQRGG